MSEIHKIEKNGVTIYPATTTDAVVDADTRLPIKDLLQKRIVELNSALNEDEKLAYEHIQYIKVSCSYFTLAIESITKNYSTYGNRVLFRHYSEGKTYSFEIKEESLFDGKIHSKEFSLEGTSFMIYVKFSTNAFADGVVLSKPNNGNYISPVHFFDDFNAKEINTLKNDTQALKNDVLFINNSYLDLQLSDLSREKDKKVLEYVRDIQVAGFSTENSLKVGIYSLVVGHPTYKYQIGLAIVSDSGITKGIARVDNFNDPVAITIGEYNVKCYIDVQNVEDILSDSDRILVSESGEPRLYLSKTAIVKAVVQQQIQNLEQSVSSNEKRISDLEINLKGNQALPILKYPESDYSEEERLIISSIKNIGFENVPEGIIDDDIFVRAFSASSETGGSGKFGQQIYFANKRIYNETKNWKTASILVAPATICDFQQHDFDVTVESSEMKGMRIRVTIDYSVFSDGFNYGTNINNKVVFNLAKKYSEGTINEQIENLQEQLSTIEKQQQGTYNAPMPSRNVVFMGSSNVWGNGFLFYSYLKTAIEWLYKSSGKFNSAMDLEIDGGQELNNPVKFLDGVATKISGTGKSITFKHRGNELNICQVIERTSAFAVIGLYEGNEKIAEFTNHNDTIGSDTKTFLGDGSRTRFELDRCFTYNHTLMVNSQKKTVQLNTAGYGVSEFPEGVDCLVIRSVDASGKVIHSLWFKEAPANGADIQITYDYGETICFVKSTVGETTEGTNESAYGDGTIAYDPVNPANIGSGLDFRLVNEKAFFRYWFDTDKERELTLKIEGGTDPYFILNFTSSVFHNIMNAGIGGYTAEQFNEETGNPNTSWHNVADYFTPDFISIGLTGNDDWRNYPRKIHRTINMGLAELRDYPSLEIDKIAYKADDGTYDVTVNSGTITAITPTSLACEEIKSSQVEAGDFVRIGTYTGDLRQVQTRRIESVDLEEGVITWAEPLHLNEYICLDSLQDLVGQDVSIRSIGQYMAQMKKLISNLLRINSKCKICLFNVYYTDLWNRNVAEYMYNQMWIAADFPANVFVWDAWKYSRDYVERGRKSREIETQANGTKELSFSSPSSLGHWEGIEVWVNNRNVYGLDCYVQTGWLYTVDPDKTEESLNYTANGSYLRPNDYRGQMKLVWKKNIPAIGTAIKIKLTYFQWSSDYAHPSDNEAVYNSLGRALVYALQQ